jgi:N-acyl-phosphatidylethanolamine-hydrolysing phospholipase D
MRVIASALEGRRRSLLWSVRLSSMASDSAHHTGGGFENPWGAASRQARLGSLLKWLLVDRPRHWRRGSAAARRTFARRFAPVAPTFPGPRAAPTDLVATWIGHATFLIQIGGRNLLTDPIWGERASPIAWAGPRRWLPPGVDFTGLPPIDAILISHNHYDHLDEPTVQRLVGLTPPPRWYVPLGVGAWLERRGARGVTELDWWGEARWDDPPFTAALTLTAAPAQHFSGRGVADHNRTLWCGWVVRAGSRAVWFVGDTGRHPVFGDIGRRLGPFDAVLMPIGAYDPRGFMGPVHVSPEDAVAGYAEAAAGAPAGGPTPVMAGMHWGTFRLTDEPMDEPPARALAAWQAARLAPDRLWLPRAGETRFL